MEKSQNLAAVKRTVSQETELLITAKCQIIDLHAVITDAMELIYGGHSSDRFAEEVCEKLTPIRDLVNSYIINSIDENVYQLDSSEF